MPPRRIVGIVGRSNAGKTTLICRILPLLGDRRVAVIKRSHHSAPTETPGKDTDRYLEAGAWASALVTASGTHIWKAGGPPEHAPGTSLEDAAARMETEADITLVESGLNVGPWPRILINHGRADPVLVRPPNLAALVTPTSSVPFDVPYTFGHDQIAEIARFVIRITA